MKIDILNQQGEKIEKMDLSDSIFGITPNESVLTQYIRVFLSNQRVGNASIKTRGEVSGGGKKPWKQKGTGRARVGSNRSPLWRHGGITHGPKPKSWALDFPKKMKTLALFSVLSSKTTDKKVTVLDDLKIENKKTKNMIDVLNKLNLSGKTLLVLGKKDENVNKSASNVPGLSVATFDNVSAFNLLKADNLVFTKDAVSSLDKKYANK